MTLAQSAFAMLVRLVSGAQAVVDEGYGGARPASVLALPRQAVYYANHSSHLDFATIWAVLPGTLRRRARPVAAADYWGAGLRGRFAGAMFRPVLVRRPGRAAPEDAPRAGAPEPAAEAPRGLRGQLASLAAALEAGESLIIFPEGTRGATGELAAFQPGLAKLARAYPEVPVVPVALSNLGRILPKGGLVPVPLLGRAAFLAPIAPLPREDDRAFLERARATLVEALPDPDAERDEELADGVAPPGAEAEPEARANDAGARPSDPDEPAAHDRSAR